MARIQTIPNTIKIVPSMVNAIGCTFTFNTTSMDKHKSEIVPSTIVRLQIKLCIMLYIINSPINYQEC